MAAHEGALSRAGEGGPARVHEVRLARIVLPEFSRIDVFETTKTPTPVLDVSDTFIIFISNFHEFFQKFSKVSRNPASAEIQN